MKRMTFHRICRKGMFLALLLSLTARAGDQPGTADVQASPKARADFAAAMQYIKAVEYEKAISLFNKVSAQSPNNPVPYIDLALVYRKMQNLTLAEENLKQAIKADPWNPVANNELALLYRKTGRFAEARKIYEKILDKYPNFAIAHKNLGILCDLYMNDNACALKHYEIYSSFMPNDAAARIWIADLKAR
jgi:tetratricopeptide (TPR) repeat protein